MLYKEIPCSKCNGHGFITHCSETGISAEQCPECCNGITVVPMTNRDILRSCNSEELIKVRHNLNTYAIYSGGKNSRLLNSSLDEDFLFWLNKDADDIDIETIFGFVDKEKYQHPYLNLMSI